MSYLDLLQFYRGNWLFLVSSYLTIFFFKRDYRLQ